MSSPNNSNTRPAMPIWYNQPYNVSMFVIYTIVISAALIGNFLVCMAVCINPKLRHNVASYFIVSLAVSDILTAAFSMPFDLESYVTFGNWFHGEILCVVWTTAYLITVPTSIWNLFILSIDRYKTLKNPWDRFKKSPFMTKKRAVIIIALLWILCMAYALLPVMGWKLLESTLVKHPFGAVCIFNLTPHYAILSAVVNFYLPMLAMCFLYYKIYQIARTQYLSRPTSGLELKTCDSNGSPVVKPKWTKRISKEFAQMHRKESRKAEENNSHDPAAINNVVQTNGVDNLAVEVEEKLNRSGTIVEELDETEENAKQTTACDHDDSTSNRAEREQDDERGHDSAINDETKVQSEIVAESRDTNDCENHGSQPEDPEDKLRQTDAINESETERKASQTDNHIFCDKDLNVEQRSKNTTDDDKEAEGMQSPMTKSNENSGFFDHQEAGTEQKELEETPHKNEDSLCTKEDISEEVASSAPHPPSDEITEHNDGGVSSDPTPPRNDFLQQDNHLNPNMEQNTRCIIVDPVIVDTTKMTDDSQTDPSSSKQNGNFIPRNSMKLHSQDSCHTTPQISPQMQEFLRRKISDGNGIKTGSIDSLESISTLQSTLDDQNRANSSRNDLSASRETLTNFGSMEDLTKRRKLFVKNKKAAWTISIIVGGFLLCWFPRTTFSIITNICQHKCFTSREDKLVKLYVGHVLTLLGYMNCAVNPIIYSYRNVQFRKSYRKMLRKVFPCLRTVVRPNTS